METSEKNRKPEIFRGGVERRIKVIAESICIIMR